MNSLKQDIIVHAIKKSNLNYKDAIPKALEDYIRAKYKCSLYLTRKIIKELNRDNATEKENL